MTSRWCSTGRAGVEESWMPNNSQQKASWWSSLRWKKAGDFCWVKISRFPWKFNGGTCLIWSMSMLHHVAIDQTKTLGRRKDSILQKSWQNNIICLMQISDLLNILPKLSDSLRICGTCWNYIILANHLGNFCRVIHKKSDFCCLGPKFYPVILNQT